VSPSSAEAARIDSFGTILQCNSACKSSGGANGQVAGNAYDAHRACGCINEQGLCEAYETTIRLHLYKQGSTWIFDDTAHNIKQEPFVEGSSEMIDLILSDFGTVEAV
jgi:hypothetical protein